MNVTSNAAPSLLESNFTPDVKSAFGRFNEFNHGSSWCQIVRINFTVRIIYLKNILFFFSPIAIRGSSFVTKGTFVSLQRGCSLQRGSSVNRTGQNMNAKWTLYGLIFW